MNSQPLLNSRNDISSKVLGGFACWPPRMSLSGQAPLRSSPSKCLTASTDRRGDAEVFTFAGKCVEYDQYDHDRSVASCGRNATGLGPRDRGLTGRDRIAPETLDVCVCVCVRACVCTGNRGSRGSWSTKTPVKRACLYPPCAPARAAGGYTHLNFQLHLHLAACCAIPGVWHSEGMTHTVTDHFSLFSYAIPSV